MLSTFLESDAEVHAIPLTWWPRQPTLEQGYSKVLMWTNFPRYLFNGTLISLSAALVSTLVRALAVYGFFRFHFMGRSFLTRALLASQTLPGILLVSLFPFGLTLVFSTLTLLSSAWMLKGFIDTSA